MSAGNGPRCAALVGPYLSGKTTLLESMLFACGAIDRKGTIKDGNTVGDSAEEAKARTMSTETTAATAEYLGDRWTFLDCPGSIEFAQDGHDALMVADMAVVVCEPDPTKARAVAPLLKFLDQHAIPHLLFVNKMDQAGEVRVRDLLEALQASSDRPLVLRQVPIRDGEAVTGYVDLVSERAYQYRPGQESDLVQIPSEVQEREAEARQELLESLADFDDALLEQLLEDAVPPKEEVYQHLHKNVASDRIVPVLLGAGEHEHGVRRLLKALRHDTPSVAETAARLGVDPEGGDICAQVFKTLHLAHAGKLSLVRVLRGTIKDGDTLNGERVSGIFAMTGHKQEKRPSAASGETVAFGRMEEVKTGQLLTPSGKPVDGAEPWPAPLTPLYSFAIQAEKREDEVKLSGALGKLMEEDPSLKVEQNPDTNEMLLLGQGEIHLQVAMDKLRNRFKLGVSHRRPQTPYKETIRKGTQQHARFKRQSGGHGQFGDVHIEIKPLPRGAGFEFENNIVGGSIPKQYIPSVENGVQEYMARGPLGFPVVDVGVRLFDGQYHSVDSSDQAFKTAGRMAMSEGMPKCDPVLLEPIFHVAVSVPSDFTSNAQRIISSKRGQILGFDGKPGWDGWDEVQAHLPQAELHDLIVELRSQTQGVGTFEYRFDHLAELQGRLADEVVQQRVQAAE